MPPGGLHDVYAPPGGVRLLIRPELRIRLPPIGFDDVLYVLPGGAGLLIRPKLKIRVPFGGFHDVLYAPQVVRACCLGPDLMIYVPPGGLHDLIYAPHGGADLLIRPKLCSTCPLVACMTYYMHLAVLHNRHYAFSKCGRLCYLRYSVGAYYGRYPVTY